MCAHNPGLVGTANVFHLNSWLTFSHLFFYIPFHMPCFASVWGTFGTVLTIFIYHRFLAWKTVQLWKCWKKMCDIMIELFYVFIKTKYLTKLRWRIMYSKSLLENKQQGLSVMLNAIYYSAAYQINKLHWHGILIWGFCWIFCTVLVRLVLSFYHNNKEYTAIIFQCYLIYHFKSTITFFYRVVS